MTQVPNLDLFMGRKEELRSLLAALHGRESRLVWGPSDAGKSALIRKLFAELTESERRGCICWKGPATRRQLLSHIIGQLFAAGNPFVRKRVDFDGARAPSLDKWLQNQTGLGLRGILFTALKQGCYQIFVDHFPPITTGMARLMKEIMYRCETPIYLGARDHCREAIGYAWSLYWNDSLRIHVGPLNDREALCLLERCIRAYGLESLDLGNFRDEILRLSDHLPGAIVKMCELAANSRYHYGDRIKTKLVHVDYLMQSSSLHTSPTSRMQ